LLIGLIPAPQTYANEFNIELSMKLFANGLKVKGSDILIYNRRGELFKENKDAGWKLKFTLPLDDDFIIFIINSSLETKVINFHSQIEGMAISDFWGKHKFKTELLSNKENQTQKTLHAIERIDWSQNTMSFKHMDVALLHKYRSDFDYFIKNKKYGDCTKLIYKNINEFLNGEKAAEDEITPDVIKQKASQNKETLEQLLLKRELIKAELESTLLKVDFLEDPILRQDIQRNVAAVEKMINALDFDIERAKKDYSQTLKILTKYEDIDDKLYQLKTQFRLEAELPPQMVDDEDSFVDRKHLLKNKSINNTMNSVDGSSKNKPANSSAKKQTEELSPTSPSAKGEDKTPTPKPARKKSTVQIAESVGSEIKKSVQLDGPTQATIDDLVNNHKPVSSYVIKILGEDITVTKYKTKEGIFEVLSNNSNQIQMLKNNILITEDVITQKELTYYKKLEKLNQIDIRYDKIGDIKKTPIKGLIFRIQIGAVATKAAHSFRNVSQFGPLAEDYNNGMYKYMIGEYETLYKLSTTKKEVKEIISGAFSVAYYYGTRVTMKHAYNIISDEL
jgi:hypothetical protein